MTVETAHQTPPAAASAKRPLKLGYARLVWRQFVKRRLAVLAVVYLVLMGAVAVFGPFLANAYPLYMVKGGKHYLFPNAVRYADLADVDFTTWRPGKGETAFWPPVPFSYDQQDLHNRWQSPDRVHLLGTDDRGRDVLSRIIWGARIAMSVGFVAEGISVLVGVLLGALAGYYRGKVDAIILRLIEVMMCFPTFALILTLVALLRPSIWNIMIVLGVTGWTGTARLVRGEFLKLREMDFATAARASGLRDWRIMFRHLMPNALSPVFVSATFGVAGAILAESTLSFLGFGVPPPTASWGEILSQSKQYLYRGTWWLVWFPGLAVFLTVTAFNFVGEGLRDAMDPRLRQ